MGVKNTKISELEKRQSDLSAKLAALPKSWKDVKKKQAQCDKCYDYKDKTVGELVGDNKSVLLCEEHFSDKYARKEIEDELKTEIEKVKVTLDFQERLSKITRYAQAKELVQAVQAILKRAKGSYSDIKWNQDELDKGLMLLRMLNKIKPKSSVFLDKGVAVNSDLYVGTSQSSRGRYYDDAERQIALTVLDFDERYRSIARAPLTIGQAERLRNLLTECIEHVRITNMMTRIQSKMKLELPKEEQFEAQYEEE